MEDTKLLFLICAHRLVRHRPGMLAPAGQAGKGIGQAGP